MKYICIVPVLDNVQKIQVTTHDNCGYACLQANVILLFVITIFTDPSFIHLYDRQSYGQFVCHQSLKSNLDF